MSSPVVTIAEGMKEKKRIKTEIGVGYVVKGKVAEMEDNISYRKRSRMRKEVVRFSRL